MVVLEGAWCSVRICLLEPVCEIVGDMYTHMKSQAAVPTDFRCKVTAVGRPEGVQCSCIRIYCMLCTQQLVTLGWKL